MMFQACASAVVAVTSVTVLVAWMPLAAMGQSNNTNATTNAAISTTTSMAPNSGAGGCPNQATNDLQWAGMPHGVADRPWISDLSVTTAAGVNTSLWTALASPSVSPPSGWENVSNRFSVVVSPTNMCGAGQTPALNNCHAVPNRVQLNFVCTSNQASNFDLSLCGVDNSSTIDFTLRMGSYFSPLMSWGWMNGDFSMWQQTTAAADGTITIRARISPVTTLNMVMPTSNQCCTCDMPSNCESNTSYGSWPGLGLFMQVSGHTVMDGCIFATTKSIMGAMAPINVPGSNMTASLMYRLVSAHFMPDGVTLMQGRLRALLPIATLATLFPTTLNSATAVAQAIASNQLSMSRNSSAQSGGATQGASSDVVSFFQWSASVNGTDALIAYVDKIGFSTPSFYLGPAGALNPLGGGGGGGGNGTRSGAARTATAGITATAALVASMVAMMLMS